MRYAAPVLLMLPVLLMQLAGCSSTAPGKNSAAVEKTAVADIVAAAKIDATQQDLDSFTQSAAFTVRWHRNIGDVGYTIDYSSSPITHPGEIRWHSRTDFGDMGNSTLQPALLGDAIYVANAKGKILRLKRDTGEQQWRVDTGITITGGVGAGDGLILIGGEKGEVAAYGEDGKRRWQTIVSSEVLGPPQVAEGIVVVRTGDGRITGLGAADGKRKWLYEHSIPALAVRSNAGVTIRHGVIFAGFAGGRLAAIKLSTGNLNWEATLSEPRGTTELERISDITSPPQADDEMVCAVSFQGRIGCFGATQGNLLWSRELSSDKGMEMMGKFIYVADAQGEILAMDKSSGSSVWKNGQLDKRRTVAPLALGEFLVAGDYRGYLYAMKREDGNLAARLKTDGSPILAAPLEMDGGLLVQTFDGGLYSVSLH
ncbi:MAG TPA: outer membrane protein assembly factor BamB [Gallionellaceae bacterium]|nr:outer membrane protein assembly factor BamB [Gallionellaceae bacterium]